MAATYKAQDLNSCLIHPKPTIASMSHSPSLFSFSSTSAAPKLPLLLQTATCQGYGLALTAFYLSPADQPPPTTSPDQAHTSTTINRSLPKSGRTYHSLKHTYIHTAIHKPIHTHTNIISRSENLTQTAAGLLCHNHHPRRTPLASTYPCQPENSTRTPPSKHHHRLCFLLFRPHPSPDCLTDHTPELPVISSTRSPRHAPEKCPSPPQLRHRGAAVPSWPNIVCTASSLPCLYFVGLK